MVEELCPSCIPQKQCVIKESIDSAIYEAGLSPNIEFQGDELQLRLRALFVAKEINDIRDIVGNANPKCPYNKYDPEFVGKELVK